MSEENSIILSISEINRLARLTLESRLPSCWVRGEISNLLKAGSGHWYFTLKDATASARGVMFKTRNQFVDWPLRDGDQIEARVQASLYEARGDYQLIVDAVRKSGQGSLFETFLRLKAKLLAEGMFEAHRKRPLPAFPHRIGVITSPQGAALHDVLTTLRRRWPLAQIIVYPCQVQGEGGNVQILEALRLARRRAECDVLLMVRGGGSLEDLWPYNDEALARAMRDSPIPIVSGIGHETDFTIADFVADVRTPTPTGAAQAVAPDWREQRQHVETLCKRLRRPLHALLEQRWLQRDALHQRLRHPRERLRQQRERIIHLNKHMQQTAWRISQLAELRRAQAHAALSRHRPRLNEARRQFDSLLQRLQASRAMLSMARSARLHKCTTQLPILCPSKVLERGYSIVRSQRGEVVTNARQTEFGQSLHVELAQGRLNVRIEEIQYP